LSKSWTEQELEFLREHWGITPLKGLARRLGRSENAVIIKVTRLELGAFLESGDYLTLNQLYAALGISNGSSTYHKTSWIKKRGLPVRYKTVKKCKFQIIKLADFWRWAEQNQDILDFSRFEPLSLGKEPGWVEQKRRFDNMKSSRVKQTPWTAYEDKLLQEKLKLYRYTAAEIARDLHRSEGAVIRRISELGIMYRPLRNSSHGTPWTADELEVLHEKIVPGSNYTALAVYLPRHSEKAIRGRVYRLYGSENLDKVRKKMKEEEYESCDKNTNRSHQDDERNEGE